MAVLRKRPNRQRANVLFCFLYNLVSENHKAQTKNIWSFQVSALKKLSMVCHDILYRNCIVQYIFPHFPANLTTSRSQLTIKCLESGQKPR